MRYWSLSLFCLLLLYCCSPPAQKQSNAATTTPAKTTKVPAATSGIQWQRASQAQALAKQSGKDILFFVHAPWCSKCDAYRQTVFSDKEVIDKINQNFIPVAFNAQESGTVEWNGKNFSNPDHDASKPHDAQNTFHELVYHVGAEAIPYMLVMDSSLGTLQSFAGLKEKKTFLFLLGNATGRW